MKTARIIITGVLLLSIIAIAAAADSDDIANSAGALYSSSVDLANEGKYQAALDAADQALALNVPALTGLIQSNRAGILVMLNRYDEAITAADAALAVEGNLTTVHSIAWYNRGNALKALGRLEEAKESYARAYALDSTLVPPVIIMDTPARITPSTTAPNPVSPAPRTTEITLATAHPATTKSPLSIVLVMASIIATMAIICRSKT